ncbi:MAG: glycosyltransferase family 4 protein [Solirubrobacterales bacterium]
MTAEAAPPRLLVVSPLAHVAGGEEVALRLLGELGARGWPATLTVPGEGELRRRAEQAGIVTRRLPLGPPERRTASSLLGGTWATALARRHDVALLNGLSTQRVVPALMAAGVPALVHVNNPVADAPRAWGRPRFWRAVRGLVCDSDHTAAECRAAGAPPGRVHVVPAPAWSGGSEPPGRSGGDRHRGEGVRVGFVGSLEPRKGVSELIEAAQRALPEQPGASLEIVGAAPPGDKGAYARRCVELAGAGPGADQISFAGPVAAAAETLDRYDVLCVPSRSEPYGTVAAEAAARGVPVIATRVGGLAEVVLHDRTGLLVAAGDTDELAGALRALLGDPARRRRLGDQAVAMADRFSPVVYADRVGELLRRAVAGGVTSTG